MQIFCPYASPLETAKCLDPKRLNRQIQEAEVILDAIHGTGKGWFNHPVTNMYTNHWGWLYNYFACLYHFKIGNLNSAKISSDRADSQKPPFLTEEFCIQHRRRLYTKNKEYYKQFAEYGESEENWYCIGGKIVKYINGKRIE